MDFHGQNTARGACVLLAFSMYLILARMDRAYLILATDLNKTYLVIQQILPTQSMQTQYYVG